MTRKLIRSIVCAAALILAVPAAMAANIPTTPEQHFVLAKKYQEQAAAHRKEAQEHREMAEAYKNSAQNTQAVKRGEKLSWQVKMEKHCEAIATAAEKLAVEDEKAADFHTLRGKELQGK